MPSELIDFSEDFKNSFLIWIFNCLKLILKLVKFLFAMLLKKFKLYWVLKIDPSIIILLLLSYSS